MLIRIYLIFLILIRGAMANDINNLNVDVEIGRDNGKYGFANDDRARENLRKSLRVFFGHKHDAVAAGNLKDVADPSEFNKLLHGNNAAVQYNSPNSGAQQIKIDGKKFIEQQKNVKVYYDQKYITPQEVHDLFALKTHSKKVNIPASYNNPEAYRIDLEEKASYVMMRGEATKYVRGDGVVDPVDVVYYYGTFPNLSDPKTNDYKKFINPNDGALNPTTKGALQQKFKDVIKLQILTAIDNNEAADILTPNAFFEVKKNAKTKVELEQLFGEAIKAVANDPTIPTNFKGLFVHPSGGFAANTIPANTRFPIKVNKGDITAPQRLAYVNKAGFNVATCIMGDGVSWVGNGAMGDRANRAAEENETRRSFTIPGLFSSKFNANLRDQSQYKQIDIATGVATAPQQAQTQQSPQAQAMAAVQGAMGNLAVGNEVRAEKIGHYNGRIQLHFSSTGDAAKFHAAFPGLTETGGKDKSNVYIKTSTNRGLGAFERGDYTYVNFQDAAGNKAKEMEKYIPARYSTKITDQGTLSVGKTSDLKKAPSQSRGAGGMSR
jgi:hypothetical protein